MNIKPHEPVKCPVCSTPLKVHSYNKVLQKRVEGNDWAEMWCPKCNIGFDSSIDKVTPLGKEKISGKVKKEVWNRDKGKCVKCGSRDKLEYDHIIPASKGGSNTARNIELLCEKCNRKKTDKIG